MKYHLISLGCQMNISDSERVNSLLEKHGYVYTEDEKEANLLGIIACSVRQKAIDKVYSKINQWNKRKDNSHLITFLSGCVLAEDRTKFLKLFDIVFPMSELNQLPEILNQYGVVTPMSLNGLFNSSEKNEHIEDFWKISPQYNSDFEAYVPIQNGCDKFCTFCAVPYTRGREVSRPSDEILQEVKTLIDHNYKSITLLGQNVNSYGLEKEGHELSFPDLLRKIGELGEQSNRDFWVYFTSPHPRDMTDEVIDVVAKYKCLAKQIHLPLQSGDDKVLIRMNRKHSVSQYRRIIHKIRNTIPKATVFTDIIVGFTGEEKTHFENTCKAMEEFKFNMAYIAMYSQRPGATSSRWVDDVPHNIKKKRLHHLTDILQKHIYQYNQRLIGKTLKVLVTGRDKKDQYYTALTEGKIVLRFKSNAENLIGKFCDIKITDAAKFSIEGQLVTEKLEYHYE